MDYYDSTPTWVIFNFNFHGLLRPTSNFHRCRESRPGWFAKTKSSIKKERTRDWSFARWHGGRYVTYVSCHVCYYCIIGVLRGASSISIVMSADYSEYDDYYAEYSMTEAAHWRLHVKHKPGLSIDGNIAVLRGGGVDKIRACRSFPGLRFISGLWNNYTGDEEEASKRLAGKDLQIQSK